MHNQTDKPAIARLRSQIGGARDGALLRFSLGSALLGNGDAAAAVPELRAALDFNPAYSAAWKLLGQALLQTGDAVAAGDVWREGIVVANNKGDIQAGKEMTVFLKRLKKGD